MRAWVAAFGIALVWSASPKGQEDATSFAAALQRRYDGVRDFQADFVQTYRGGALRRQLTEQGRVVVRKPSRMRWDYTAPEEKLFVSDGAKIYSYFPADKQVIVSDVPPDAQASTPGLFLAGRGNLTRDFTATFAQPLEGMPNHSRVLKLVPKTPQPDYEWLMLVANTDTLAIVGLVWADAQGGTSSFSFSNLKENIEPPDKLFAFNIPRGVEVVTDSPPR